MSDQFPSPTDSPIPPRPVSAPDPQLPTSPSASPDDPTPAEMGVAQLKHEITLLKRQLRALDARPYADMRDINRLDEEIDAVRQVRNHSHEYEAYPRDFDAQITGFQATSGTPYKWKEMVLTSAAPPVMVAMTSGRICSSVTAMEAAIEMNGWKFVSTGTNVRMRAYTGMSKTTYCFVAALPAPVNPYTKNQGLGLASGTHQAAWMLVASCST